MTTHKKAPAVTEATQNNSQANDSNTSTAAQRSRLLKHLREVGPVSTLQARELLNIYSAPPRVFELRNQGHNIVTIWVRERDNLGRLHRVGRYALMSGKSDN
ncbi:MAG: helix-turn-helix domain-containing protein [Pseudomonadota bacterium]